RGEPQLGVDERLRSRQVDVDDVSDRPAGEMFEATLRRAHLQTSVPNFPLDVSRRCRFASQSYSYRLGASAAGSVRKHGPDVLVRLQPDPPGCDRGVRRALGDARLLRAAVVPAPGLDGLQQHVSLNGARAYRRSAAESKSDRNHCDQDSHADTLPRVGSRSTRLRQRARQEGQAQVVKVKERTTRGAACCRALDVPGLAYAGLVP